MTVNVLRLHTYKSFQLTVRAVHVESAAFLALVPVAAALRVGPEP